MTKLLAQTQQETKKEIKMQDVVFNPEDMLKIQGMIEVAAKRGAYHASEMKEVGEVYDRLAALNKKLVELIKEQKEKDENTVVVDTPTETPQE